jgi:serine/threonine-protein kinase
VKHAPKSNAEPPLRTQVRQLGEYGLIAELARGGMGRVFLARRVGEAGFERLYAVKIMHEHMMDDPEAVLMLLDEANIASQIHHPNVVAITDIGTYDGGYYLVMDYVEGCSLSQLLSRNKRRRPPNLIIPLLLDSLRGLHGAHELNNAAGDHLNLVHRDFSPQNLLVGIDGTCRVTDFGIAKASARLTHTRSSIQKGKIAYMAPEQVTLSGHVDRRVDIWAAGVVLWYALTGEHPFRGETQAATIHNILNKDIVPPSSVGLNPPRCFDHVCLKALQRHRERRYQTAQEMADELQQIAVRNNLLAPPSEISAWVQECFGEDIAQRRNVIRAIKGEGGQVAWISTPVLPRFAVTPSTGMAEHLIKEAERLPQRFPELSNQPVLSAAPLPTHGWPQWLASPIQQVVAQKGTVLAIVVGILIGFGVVSMLVGNMPPPLRGSTAASQNASATELIRTDEPGPPTDPPTSPAAATLSQDNARRAQRRRVRVTSEPVPARGAQGSRNDNRVRIVFRGLPPEAQVLLDHQPVEGTEHRIAADGRNHRVSIRAPGFEPWHRTFKAMADVVFDVHLTEATSPAPRATRSVTRPPSSTAPAAPRRTQGPSLVRDPGF